MSHYRFIVEYVHRDGNRYRLGSYSDLLCAQANAVLYRMRPDIIAHRLPVIVTDLEDSERGDVSNCDDYMEDI